MAAPKVESVALGKLTPSPWNPRTIRDERFQNLCASIEADPEFLWRRPILATADGTIYAGNMRYRAASHLKMSAVPAIVEDVPEKLAKERALRDNAQWGDWNDDQLAEMVYQMAASGSDVKLLGIEEDELARLLGLTGADGTEGLTDPDELPEDVPTRSKRGDLWLLGEHRVLCGDATSAEDVARVMGGEKASCMWTDPPYGVSYVGKTKDALTIQNDGADDLPAFLHDTFATVSAALRPGAAIYIARPAGALSVVFGVAFVGNGWRLHEELQWVKDSMVLGHSDYHLKHETIMYGYAPGEGRFGRGGKGWYGDDSQVSVFEVDRPKASPDHPTGKPVELVSVMLRNSTAGSDVVYDPFLGSGTTLIACEQLGRKCYGLEIEPKYVDVILRRWENFTGKTAVLA